MLARLQQMATLGLLAAGTLWVAFFISRGEHLWAWVGASTMAFGYAVVLALEFILLAFVQDGIAAPRATPRELVRAWWGEVATTPLVFFWRQPFRSSAEADFVPERPNGRRGVVLVHGFFCNRAVWNPWMAQLRRSGTPFVAVTMEPVFGNIDLCGHTLETAVEGLRNATGLAPVIVAHSMGGLAVRAWLATTSLNGRPEAALQSARGRVHRVITIGTPHQGTWLARFGHAANGRQMRVGSGWLVQLAAGETAAHCAGFTCFYSNCDNIVFPAWRATLRGADNRHVPGAAHVQMAFDPRVFDETLRWTRPPSEAGVPVSAAAPAASSAAASPTASPPASSAPANPAP